jgi:PAS domain S-box-containing protein
MIEKPTYEELEKRVKELEQSKEKYRHLFETAMVGIYRTRIEDGKVLAANDSLARMMGYDTVNTFVEEYVTSEHYADPEHRQELLNRLNTHGKVDGFEIEMKLIDGSRIQVALSATIFPERGYIEGVIIDITERKRAEAEIKRKRERDRAWVSICLWDHQKS